MRHPPGVAADRTIGLATGAPVRTARAHGLLGALAINGHGLRLRTPVVQLPAGVLDGNGLSEPSWFTRDLKF
jgi:hypothetical protein